MNGSKIERLAALPLFSACRPHELRRVAKLVDESHARPGQPLCREGRPGREVFVVLSGRADVRVGDRSVGRLGPGDVFGEMAVLREGLRTATVTALTPMRLGVLEARAFTTLVETVPVVGRRILAVLAGRLERAQALAG